MNPVVISANRGPNRANKNWRIYEKESLERHFGSVIDVNGEDGVSVLNAYNKYFDSVKYIRWYTDPELMTSREYEGSLAQSRIIGNVPYLINSAKGFKNVQCKHHAFKTWTDAGVRCPKHFSFSSREEFNNKISEAEFSYPYLLRVTDSVNGGHSFIVRQESELEMALSRLLSVQVNFNGIDSTMICVEYLDTIDKDWDVNYCFRIHVSGDKVISGYARVVDKEDWCAITGGKFNIKNKDSFIHFNKVCEQVCRDYEKEICEAVHALGLNMQGVDVVINQENMKPYFLEVQPTYAAGYPKPEADRHSYCPPFWNPYDKPLVDFLVKERSFLEKELPMYYNNWLDKRNHFDLAYKSLKEFVC